MNIFKALAELIRGWGGFFCTLVGGLWTLMEILHAVFPQNALINFLHGNLLLYTLVPLIGTAVKIVYDLKTVTVSLGDGNKICVEYGDILKHKKGNIVIGINEDNESELNVIGKESLHGQLVDQYGDAVDAAIKHCKEKHSEEEHSEEIVIPFSPEGEDRTFLLLKMAKLNSHNNAIATEAQIDQALKSLFQGQDDEYNSSNSSGIMYIPLLSKGHARNKKIQTQRSSRRSFWNISKCWMSEKTIKIRSTHWLSLSSRRI